VGAAITAAGIVWTLQGVGDVGGSFMSGDKLWAIIGPVTAAAGVVVAAAGLFIRRRPGGRG
jgi:hypothetical protein